MTKASVVVAAVVALLLTGCLMMGEDLSTPGAVADLERGLLGSTSIEDEDKAVAQWAAYCERFPSHDPVDIVWREESGAIIEGHLSRYTRLPEGNFIAEVKPRRGPSFTYQMKSRDNALRLDRCR